MNSLDNKSLLEGMAKYGYPLIAPQIDAKPAEILTGIAMSDEARFWEGFPVVLATLMRDKDRTLDLGNISNAIEEPEIRERFHKLCFLSLLVFDHMHFDRNVRDAIAGMMRKQGSQNEENLQAMRNQFVHKGTVEINGKLLSAERLITTFMNYVTNQKLFEKASLDEKAKLREEFNQEFHMSQLFTPKQKDIIRKKMAAEPLTKTEREYYSRTIRKKILALADPELYRLAQKLLEL